MPPRRRPRARAWPLVWPLLLRGASWAVRADDWTATRDCSSPCPLDAPPCLVSSARGRQCLALAPTNGTRPHESRVALGDAAHGYTFGALDLAHAPDVETLWLDGDGARVAFDAAGRWTAARLSSLVLSGLTLSVAALPTPAPSVRHVQIRRCVLDRAPLQWLLTLPHVETLELLDTRVTAESSTLLTVSEAQYVRLRRQWTGDGAQETRQVRDALGDRACARGLDSGTVQHVGGWPVCVTRAAALRGRRRLMLFESLGTDEKALGGAGGDDHDTPTLVVLSLSLPFVFFLYKTGLFVFFLRTYGRYCRENGAVRATAAPDKRARYLTLESSDSCDTSNASSTTPLPSPSPHGHRRRKKQRSSVASSSQFWVTEELQPWRLDFQRLKMRKSLTLLPTERRCTLRKQSITSAMNPREIWLASLATRDASTAAVSPGGGTTETLVVVKFLTPSGDEDVRALKDDGDGGGSARDKLQRELKRQATFSHPQVVTFIGVAWSLETHLCAVTEYMAQGDLRHWLHRTASKQSGQWSYLKVNMLLDVSKALLYLHAMHPRLVHGNCNSRNVLLDQSLRAKLSDFGQDGRSEVLTEQELMSYSAVGSGRWISPEALLGRETSASYPDASDVYSLGILIAEMDSHALPFSDLMQANKSAVPETDILQLIARGALSPTLSPSCPKSIVKLVNACTSYKPEYRPSSAQVQEDLRHILEDFREFESQATATISIGAPRSNPPSNLV
ncbi:unnamed protein product [Hyaloperonospora brassicae]|uniref:Protein kinase domain-containing protein n=1 Tax=Hyaloperonospora brassicae TaxID=162125 RepID=A0AAV0TKF4_HYABA|nr:unnamed protein product [Hyaloperonospora brassicae]